MNSTVYLHPALDDTPRAEVIRADSPDRADYVRIRLDSGDMFSVFARAAYLDAMIRVLQAAYEELTGKVPTL